MLFFRVFAFPPSGARAFRAFRLRQDDVEVVVVARLRSVGDVAAAAPPRRRLVVGGEVVDGGNVEAVVAGLGARLVVHCGGASLRRRVRILFVEVRLVGRRSQHGRAALVSEVVVIVAVLVGGGWKVNVGILRVTPLDAFSSAPAPVLDSVCLVKAGFFVKVQRFLRALS